MRRCISKTKTGRRCLNPPLGGSDFCTVHRSGISAGEALAVGAGAVVGNTIVPGMGGIVLGGIAGRLIRIFLKR